MINRDILETATSQEMCRTAAELEKIFSTVQARFPKYHFATKAQELKTVSCSP